MAIGTFIYDAFLSSNPSIDIYKPIFMFVFIFLTSSAFYILNIIRLSIFKKKDNASCVLVKNNHKNWITNFEGKRKGNPLVLIK